MAKNIESVEEAAVTVPDTAALLAEVLAELKSVREAQKQDKEEFETELSKARADAAAAKRAAMDAFEPQPDASWIDPRTDRPGSIEEKLRAAERRAEEAGVAFDRERTKKILLGQPVEDLNKFRFMGHAFATEEEMKAYITKNEIERDRTLGRYPR